MYWINSSKAVVKVDWPMKALSMHIQLYGKNCQEFKRSGISPIFIFVANSFTHMFNVYTLCR